MVASKGLGAFFIEATTYGSSLVDDISCMAEINPERTEGLLKPPRSRT